MAKPDKAAQKAEREAAKVEREARKKDARAGREAEKAERKAARDAAKAEREVRKVERQRKIQVEVSYDGVEAVKPSPFKAEVKAGHPAHSLKGRAMDYFLGEDEGFGEDFELREPSGDVVPKHVPVSEYGDPLASFVLVKVA